MATKGIDNWPLSTAVTTPPLSDVSLCEKFPRTVASVPTRRISPETRVLGEQFCCWQYESIFIRFHIVVSESQAEKSNQTYNENIFLIKGHYKVI